MVETARGRVDSVLVVNDLDASVAAELAAELGFDVLQLHGSYDEAAFTQARTVMGRVWRATSTAKEPHASVGSYGEEALLLDAPRPGSGERWDLSELTSLDLRGHWLIAGGLDPSNVAEVISQAQPWGVDVSSGVESAPGEKSDELITAFVKAARAGQ